MKYNFYKQNLKKYISKSPIVKTNVNWYDLHPGFSITLEKSSLVKLFNLALKKAKSYTSLGKEIGVSRKVISNCLKFRYNPKIITLKSLLKYLNMSYDSVNNDVLKISNLKVKLPFILNNEKGAEIRAAFLSDGHIDKKIDQMAQYCALEKELHQQLIELCTNIFGEFPYKTVLGNKTHLTRFSSVIAYALYLSGIPRGAKRLVNCYVPRDIMLGSKKVKTAYLRRIFDDEGDVCFNGHGKRAVRLTRSREISKEIQIPNIPSEKWVRYELPLNITHNLLMGEYILLHSLKIDARIYKEGIYKSKKGNLTAKWRIQIAQQDSLKEFNKLINFSLEKKKDKLEKAVNSYQFRKLPNYEGKRQALNFIKKISKKEGYFKYSDLGKEMVRTSRSYDLAGRYLKDFCRRRIIKKLKRGRYIIKENDAN